MVSAEGPNKFIILTSPKHDVKKLQIGFEGPSQPETKLVTKANKNVDVTFTTPVGGNYKIHVMYDEHYVLGSPYNCKLVGDVKPSVDKIKVSGAIKEAKKDEQNEILIDGKDVGICGMHNNLLVISFMENYVVQFVLIKCLCSFYGKNGGTKQGRSSI